MIPARKPIRRRSKKYALAMRIYNTRVKEWLVGKQCAVFPFCKATQCHHSRGRVGSLLMDERFWVPVSAYGHRCITYYPSDARARGLLCPIGQWNVPVK